MRLIFMGTPDFSVPVLEALLGANHDVVCVYSQPPRPAGRGMPERKSPVHILAEKHSIEVRTPVFLKEKAEQEQFDRLNADSAIVVAYGLVLPKAILKAPRHGCFNVHASLLPRWRGAAPIQRAIMAGDKQSGVTIMRMDEGLDTGAICIKKKIPIGQNMSASALHDELSILGASTIVEALDQLESGRLNCTPQAEEGVVYAAKIDKMEAWIDFSKNARDVHNHIRGLSPFPGAWFKLPGKRPTRIKVLEAQLATGNGAPGMVLDGQFSVACAEGAIRLLKVQRAGRDMMDAGAFLRGTRVPAGTVLS